MIRILHGDCRLLLELLPDRSVNCCVTSPPYFGLRDYGHGGQIGLEQTPDAYVAELVAVFREVKRVLRDDGTLWLNLGDSYSRAQGDNVPQTKNPRVGFPDHAKQGYSDGGVGRAERPGSRSGSLAPKQLLGIPWRVAFALQADGWYLRQDIIWAKPNPMPESVTDRCTKSHEYIFLLSKSPKYYYDNEAIAEPLAQSSVARLSQDVENQAGSDRVPGKTNGPMKAVGGSYKGSSFNRGKTAVNGEGRTQPDEERADTEGLSGTRNKRDVWTVATRPYKGAHFATFPPKLIEPCVLAGCPRGGVVLDPFGGSGTTGQVAQEHGRNAILMELNAAYLPLIRARTDLI